MFSPKQWVDQEGLTRVLLDSAPFFCSKRAGYAFRGYAESQHQRLMGERGQMKVHRPELIDAYGYDVKYAAHTLRLTMQGVTMLREQHMPMPLAGEQRDFILAIRRGEVTFDDCVERITIERSHLDAAIEHTKLPDLPDASNVNDLIIRLHEVAWTR